MPPNCSPAQDGFPPCCRLRSSGDDDTGFGSNAGPVIARQGRREAETAPTLAGVLELQASTGQVHRKFRWTRGLFVSYSGLSARGAGSATDIICMEGCELWERHCHVNYVWAAWSRGRPAAPIMLRIGCMFVGASF